MRPKPLNQNLRKYFSSIDYDIMENLNYDNDPPSDSPLIENTNNDDTFVHESSETTNIVLTGGKNDNLLASETHHFYGDFETIDWTKDAIMDKANRFSIKRSLRSTGKFSLRFKSLCNDMSSFIVVIIVGAILGLVSFLLSSGTMLISEFKTGVCTLDYTRGYEECCWLESSNSSLISSCSHWKTWAELLGFTRHFSPSGNVSSQIIANNPPPPPQEVYYEAAAKSLVASDSTSLYNTIGYYSINIVIFVLIGTFLAWMSAIMAMYLAPYSCGSGVTETKTILGGYIVRSFLGARTVLIKLVGLLLSVGSGLNVGYEASLVHIGASVANTVCRMFGRFENEAVKRGIIAAGASAGFGAAFMAPISGLLFGLEDLCTYFTNSTMWYTFMCSLAAVTIHLTLREGYAGDNMYISISSADSWKMYEIFPFLFISVACGLMGSAFNYIYYRYAKLRKDTSLGSHPLIEVTVITAITLLVNYTITPISQHGNQKMLRDLIQPCRPYQNDNMCDYAGNFTGIGVVNPLRQPLIPLKGVENSVWQIMLLMIINFFLTAVSVSLKVPCGFILPLMVIGASFGRIVGIVIEIIIAHFNYSPFVFSMCSTISKRCINPEVYAVIGATAMLAGVTRMTVTIVVLIIEMTNSAIFLIPIMMASMVSKLVSEWVSGQKSFSHYQIALNNYPFLNKLSKIYYPSTGKSIYEFKKKLRTINNGSASISLEPIVLYQDYMSIDQVEHVVKHKFHGYPLLENRENKVLVGYIRRKDIKKRLNVNAPFINDYSAGLHNATESVTLSQGRSIARSSRVYRDYNVFANIKDVIDFNIIRIHLDTTLDTITELFLNLGVRNVYLTDGGQFIDIITKKDYLDYINDVSKMDF